MAVLPAGPHPGQRGVQCRQAGVPRFSVGPCRTSYDLCHDPPARTRGPHGHERPPTVGARVRSLYFQPAISARVRIRWAHDEDRRGQPQGADLPPEGASRTVPGPRGPDDPDPRDPAGSPSSAGSTDTSGPAFGPNRFEDRGGRGARTPNCVEAVTDAAIDTAASIPPPDDSLRRPASGRSAPRSVALGPEGRGPSRRSRSPSDAVVGPHRFQARPVARPDGGTSPVSRWWGAPSGHAPRWPTDRDPVRVRDGRAQGSGVDPGRRRLEPPGTPDPPPRIPTVGRRIGPACGVRSS